MPWLGQTTEPDPVAGILSKAWWRRPNFIPDSEPFVEIAVPSDTAGVDELPTDFETEGVRYVTGGWTQNVLFTRDLAMWSLGIEAPVEIPSVTASGTGLTAEVICYWAYSDDKTQERSPLSAGSETLSLTNQGVAWTNFPVPLNPRVTHIELWRSVDGSLPRLVLRRQVGVSGTVTESVAAGDLGEAFTEDFSKFPRCRVNAFYHDRQYMAGFEKDRTVLYASLLGFPERMSTIDLRTKNGEPIVGLQVVNDYLVVLCPFSTYTVTGFTEDDIQISVAKTDIGIIGPNAKCMVHGNMYVWTHLGLYVTDGASWFFVGKDVQPRWVQDYRMAVVSNEAHILPDPFFLDSYERAWAINNISGYCAQLFVGFSGAAGIFWVSHYEGAGPAASGDYTPPLWSYDSSDWGYTCGAVLSIPGSRQQEVVFATDLDHTGAFLQRQNVTTVYNQDLTGDQTFLEPMSALTDHESIGMVLRHSTEFFEDMGGDLAHGKRFTDLDVYAISTNEQDPDLRSTGFQIKLWTGGSFATTSAEFLGYSLNGDVDEVDFNPSFSKLQETEPQITSDAYPQRPPSYVVTAQQPKVEWHYKLARAVGDAASLELTFFDKQATFFGYSIGFKSGPKYRQRKQVTFNPV